jgi:hydroxymethylpyrimidine/phosphomethylpyrimidine kinase
MRVALTVAGSDPTGGAGLQADLKTFAAFGVYGTSAVTAVTAQSTAGVRSWTALTPDVVGAQLDAVANDISPAAVKIGMLATGGIVRAVAAAIERLRLRNVVLDPVLASSSGARLIDHGGIQALLLELMPRARVVTPNIPEAEALSGCRIGSAADLRRAAERLVDMGAPSVVITGGHATGPDAVDLFFDGRRFVELHTRRIDTRPVHGTGCTYAAALAAGLALDDTIESAAARAQEYVAGAMAHAVAIGNGALALDHFWNVRLKADTTRRPT